MYRRKHKKVLAKVKVELSENEKKLSENQSKLRSREIEILKKNRKLSQLENQIKKPSQTAEDVFKAYRDVLFARDLQSSAQEHL